MSVNRIKTIIETFLGSDMPGEVQQRFAEWLRDPASRGEKERVLESYWNGLRAEEPGGRERKLERLHEAMRRGERFRVRRIWRNVAAAAAVVLLAAGTNYVVVKDYLRTKIETNIVTSAHDKGEYVLPDGTHIWLNAGSVLRYYGDLTGRRRVVELDGEGFFKVRHDADRPFILRMEDMNIEVLGTEFDVINYAEFATTEAILCSGSIRAYVEPTLLGRDALEVAVPANFNLISMDGDRMGVQSFFGQGAGRYPTAYNVVQDLVDITRGVHAFYTDSFVPAVPDNSGVQHRYYVRTRAALPELAALSERDWDGAAITQPVPVSRMHALMALALAQDGESFFAALQ